MKPTPRNMFLVNKLAFLFSLMLFSVFPAVGQAATFTVNSTLDVAGLQANCVNANGTVPAPQCTLRSAIQAANASVGVADIIILPAGTYTLTIPGLNENAAATGDLDITGLGGALEIRGAGAATTIIDGGALDGVFETISAGGAGANATVSDVTIRNGNGDPNLGNGGGIHVNTGTTLTLNRSVVTACKALGGNAGASGVDNSGTLTMNMVAVTNNDGPGGGVNNGAAGVLTWNIGEASGNTTGGGVQNNGTITLTNVTISGNTSTAQGAGIDSRGNVTLQNVTISGNTSAAGIAAIGGIRRNNAGTISVRNTLISGNTPANCGGLLITTSQGNNIDSGTTCGFAAVGDLPNTDPLLGVLALNGGTIVKTRALPAGSPAIDKGSATVFPATDARGVARPVDGNIPLDGVATSDIGAYEFRPQLITVTLPSPFDFLTVATGTTLDHAITLANAGDGALVIGALAVPDPLAAPFSLPAAVDTCSGKTLPLAGTCAFTVRFVSPLSIVPATDTFNIPSNDPATPAVSFSVSGTGTVAPVPQIAVTDSIAPAADLQVLFGSVTTGSTADATVTITNPGTAVLVIGTIAGADPLAAPFSILNNTCSGQSIAPLATCTLTARFAPAAAGIFNDTFNIPSNDPAAPTVSFTLSGLATPLPVPLISVTDSIAPATDQIVPFNGVLAGVSADATITATNTGTADLVIGQIASATAPFSILNDTCSGQTVAPSAACTLTVHFAPAASGPASGTLVIPSNVAATPAVSIALSGTGTSLPPVPLITVIDSIAPTTDQIVPFGGVLVGSSADATITITNPGTANLVIGTIAGASPLAAPFGILNDTCSGRTVAPAATCTLTVRFAPTAVASASGTFDIPGSGLQTVTVSVNGIGNTLTTTTGAVNSPPANPVLVSPTNGQTGVSTLMTFTWKKSADPDGDAITYHFTYGTDPNFAGSQIVNVASTNSSGLLFVGLGSMGGGIILFGIVSGSGLKRSKKLLLVIPAFLLVGALFTACSSGGGDTASTPVETPTPPPTTTPPVTNPADLVSATITGLAPNTTYYWKVVADDGKGGLATSETFSFKTQ